MKTLNSIAYYSFVAIGSAGLFICATIILVAELG